ncbi:MAG: 1-acyl-sn-glycerol-3-phosphate acyltransferase [Sphingomonas bacterium]|nr:1-acyl-sn-glycerol-3-phosphate acyltransferase [Sphingomonas bacterium]
MASRSTAAAEMPSSRLRAYGRIARLALLFLAYLPPHLIAWSGGRRSPWPPRFLARAAHISGARVRIEGERLDPHSLILANHTSWLDILILGGATETRFVSKAEVAGVPLIGWLSDQNHTLYIDRAERGDAHGQVRRIATALGEPQPLAIFPEGTTGDGRALLPFRSTLLHAVAPPPREASVRPVAIDYHDQVDAIAWHGGEPGLANVLRVLGLGGTRSVTVRLLDPLPHSSDRKALARSAHAAIGAALSSVARSNALEAPTT